ncbi:MAG: RNA polymerase sigma factor [Nitrososphaerota archaeon]
MVMTHAQEAVEMPAESDSMPLGGQIAQLLSHAEPRLRQLARSQRVASDAVDDIVQETMIEAWKSLDHLRDESRFAAWLDGICRNVCLRHQRRQGVLRAHETPWNPADEQASSDDAFFAQLADPDTFDPTEELTRRDMAFLLDRALGYLPLESRVAVEQHYLAEIPQRELAARMGLSLSALEARLHRARAQMLHTFSHELRDEALSLGLAVASADAVGWRKTSITCYFCGRACMLGIFEPMADGRVNLRLRCPTCQPVLINSFGIVDLGAARSFLPATKKLVHESGRFYLGALAHDGATQCWICGQPITLRIMRNNCPLPELSGEAWLQSSCGCINSGFSAVSPYGSLPEVHKFIFGTSAIIVLPDTEVRYNGQQAIRFGLLSPSDGRRLYVFADSQTLLPLAVVVE